MRGPDPLSQGHRAANLPLKGFAQNQLWCEIVALACGLLAWMQLITLTGTARRWEPRPLRLRLFAVAGRLAASGRRLRLRLAGRWPWSGNITIAIARLQTLPPDAKAGQPATVGTRNQPPAEQIRQHTRHAKHRS